MEKTFHDDSQFRGVEGDCRSMKRPVTLDLDSTNTASEKRFDAILTSPDLMKLTLTTPEIDMFIATNVDIAVTPTPTQVLFPILTEEQENCAEGVFDAHQTTVEVNASVLGRGSSPGNDNAPNPEMSKIYSELPPFCLTTSSATTSDTELLDSSESKVLTTLNPTVRPPSLGSTNSSSCNSLPVPFEFAAEEELQTGLSDFSSPSPSPVCMTHIDMEDQERIKLEKKRYRNRIAASNSRKRKLGRIADLEDEVKNLKDENSKLEAVADNLRKQVCNLKETMFDHLKKGCKIMIPL